MSETHDTERSNGTSHGRSNGRSNGPFARRTDYHPDDFVPVKVRAAARDRFDDWFVTQYPGLTQLPSKETWTDRVFALGLDQIEKLMPPVMSPEDRLAAAMGQA